MNVVHIPTVQELLYHLRDAFVAGAQKDPIEKPSKPTRSASLDRTDSEGLSWSTPKGHDGAELE